MIHTLLAQLTKEKDIGPGPTLLCFYSSHHHVFAHLPNVLISRHVEVEVITGLKQGILCPIPFNLAPEHTLLKVVEYIGVRLEGQQRVLLVYRIRWWLSKERCLIVLATIQQKPFKAWVFIKLSNCFQKSHTVFNEFSVVDRLGWGWLHALGKYYRLDLRMLVSELTN